VTGAAFHHLSIHVSDLRRTRRFYERLGMEVLADEPGHLRLGGGDGFAIGVEERTPRDVGAPGLEIVIRVPDVDRLATTLRDEGVAVTAPSDQPSGGRHAWLHDPDGYRLSIYSDIAG
jgi:catechol 2,3-dioxygenase-like lactoylglutathione lyase family enzyme